MMNKKSGKSGLLATTVLAFALVGFAPAVAQTRPQPADATTAEANEGGIAEIVVTAQKRSEKLQNVPIAITAISGDSLAAKGIANTQDIQQATPGLTYTTVIGTASPRIRGIGTGSALAGNENSVATYVDGVYYASSAGSVMQLSNVAQVAVLKGPQGTLFGRNATGGLIQITTLDPKHELSGKVSASYGNKNTIGGSAYLTGGLSDAVAADLTLYYHNQMDGFGHNLFSGKEINKSRDFAARSKWLVEISDTTRVKIAGDYSTTRAAGPARRLIYGSRPSSAPGPNNIVARGATPFTDNNPFDVNSNVDAFFRSKQGGGSVELIHNFDSFDVSSLTAYRETTTRIIFDTDGTIANNADTNNLLKDKQFSQELQLTSTGSGPLSWTAGAYYFYGKGGYDDAFVHRPPLAFSRFRAYQRTKAPAVYGQATYKFAETTSLTVGARYSWEKRYFDANGGNGLGAGPTPITPVPPVSGNLSIGDPTWRIALDHRFSPDFLVYVSYNRGFKSGGFVPTVFTPPAQTFRPEKLDAYEVGFKSDLFDRRLRMNGSGFYYDYKDIQLTAYGSGPLPTITNAASAKIYGLDLDVTAQPVTGLTLTLGFSYIHSRFGSFPGAQIAVPLATGGNATVQGSAKGNKLPNTPDWTIDLGADYDVPLGNGGLTFSTHYFHSDGWFAEPDNYLRQNAYDQLAASVGWYMNANKTVTATAWGRNLTNAAVATQMQARVTGNVVSVSQGRTYGVTLGYKF
jgi:iron complex outermembrane receptor protein